MELDEDKVNAYRNAFAQTIINQSIDIELAPRLLGSMRQLDPIDLRVLACIADKGRSNAVAVQAIIAFLTDPSETMKHVILSSIDVLANLQLIKLRQFTLDKDHHLQREHYEYQLTDLGREFIVMFSTNENVKGSKQ